MSFVWVTAEGSQAETEVLFFFLCAAAHFLIQIHTLCCTAPEFALNEPAADLLLCWIGLRESSVCVWLMSVMWFCWSGAVAADAYWYAFICFLMAWALRAFLLWRFVSSRVWAILSLLRSFSLGHLNWLNNNNAADGCVVIIL